MWRGYFEVEKNNLIFYPTSKRQDIPHKLKVEGTWELDKNHNLIFRVDESQSKIFGKTIKFTTRITKADTNSLSFSYLNRLTPTLSQREYFTLQGKWKINPFYRLSFELKPKGKGELTFANEFSITEDNQIVYIYKRKYKGGTRIDSFILEGEWKVNRKELHYLIEGDSKNKLVFQISTSQVLVFTHKGMVKLIFGVRCANENKFLVLTGRYQDKKTKIEIILNFGKKEVIWEGAASYKIKNDLNMIFHLKIKDRWTSIKLRLEKELPKDKFLFLEGCYGRERYIKSGIYIPF